MMSGSLLEWVWGGSWQGPGEGPERLPFCRNSAASCTFTILRQKPPTFIVYQTPPPYEYIPKGRQTAPRVCVCKTRQQSPILCTSGSRGNSHA